MKENNIALASGKDLPISTKHSIEICNFIRGRSLEKSKKMLTDAIEEKRAIPFKRFNKDRGHKRTMAAGRFPKKACGYIMKLLNLAEANARNKGLDTSALYIKSIIANKGSRPWHPGRSIRRKMKRTHISIAVKEKETA